MKNTVSKPGNNVKYIMCIAFIPAIAATGLIVVPLVLWLDRLELAGKLKLPDWLVMPTVFAVISFFGLVWIWTGNLIEVLYNKCCSNNRKHETSDKDS